jgi:hypothetical protein
MRLGCALPRGCAVRSAGARAAVVRSPCRACAMQRRSAEAPVQLVRDEGRDVSSQYEMRDETCPVSAGRRRRGGGTWCSPGATSTPWYSRCCFRSGSPEPSSAAAAGARACPISTG